MSQHYLYTQPSFIQTLLIEILVYPEGGCQKKVTNFSPPGRSTSQARKVAYDVTHVAPKKVADQTLLVMLERYRANTNFWGYFENYGN